MWFAGRIIGKVCVDVVGEDSGLDIYSWVDPGVFALIGAGACLTGVTRLTVSVTVMMMEISSGVSTVCGVANHRTSAVFDF